jgi:hypothetical protein
MMRDTGAPLHRMTFLQPSARLNPLRLLARLHHWLTRPSPVRYVAFGYLAYMALGWALLSLPAAQQVPVAAVDALFIAVSAVSTTGLVRWTRPRPSPSSASS